MDGLEKFLYIMQTTLFGLSDNIRPYAPFASELAYSCQTDVLATF
jgi:hypothetical protein